MEKIIYKGKYIFTGKEEIENFILIVENGIIMALGTADKINIQNEMLSCNKIEVVSLENEYLIPGIIDSHCHVMSGINGIYAKDSFENDINIAKSIAIGVANVTDLLKSGIIACRDLGSRKGYALGIRDAINQNIIRGPEIICAGKAICATGGHGYEIGLECDGADEIAKGVRQVAKEGVDIVKLMVSGGVNSPGEEPGPPELTYDEILRGVETAHALGRKVAVHTHGNTAIRRCVQANVDSIEHGVYLSEDIMEMMIDKGTYLVPTLSAPYHAVLEGLRQEPENKDHAESKAVIQRHRDAVIKAFRMGVNVAFGTDAGSPYNLFEKVLYELVLMVKSGFNPKEAITCATQNSSELLGIDDRKGTLEIGKEANFIAYSDNPLKVIEVVMEEKRIFLRGKEI